MPPSLRGGGSSIALSFCVAANAGTAVSAALARIPLFACRRVIIVQPRCELKSNRVLAGVVAGEPIEIFFRVEPEFRLSDAK